MEKLKPCPFCGDHAEIRQDTLFFVYCRECYSRGPTGYSAMAAANRWNDRAPKQPTEQPVNSPMELLKLLGYVNGMIGYCQSLRIGTVINEGYMQRMTDHYIPNTQKACKLIAQLVDRAQAPKREISVPETVPPDGLTIADYEEVLADHRRLVRELDVALNGDGAAKQASLCDIVAQVKAIKRESINHKLLTALKELVVWGNYRLHAPICGGRADELFAAQSLITQIEDQAAT